MAELDSKAVWPGWETVRILGRGSFGAVYEIRRDVLGDTEKAALKLITIPQSSSDIEELYGEGYDDESITSTFKAYLKNIVAEYSLMRKLNGSANVVNCDDVRYVQHEDGFGWDIYIKMELLTPLTRALPKEIPDDMVIRIGADLCKALVLCKKFNIVHRDIKPANIFVSDLGDYKLGDFGIAKTVEKTSGGTKTGTYDYMAPEVYHDEPYGSTVDIYSLGMVLYWLLNERRTAFLALPPTLPTNLDKERARRRRFGGEAVPAPAHGSKELQRIVLKAVAYDHRDRYQSAEELLRDLENVQSGVRNEAISKSGLRIEESQEEATVSSLHAAAPVTPDGDATVSAVGVAINRPPVSTGELRPNAALSAARGPHPPQAVPLPPAGGRQEPSEAPAAVVEDATVSSVHAAAPAAPDEDATVSAVGADALGGPKTVSDEDATVSAVHAAAPASPAGDETVSVLHAAKPAAPADEATVSVAHEAQSPKKEPPVPAKAAPPTDKPAKTETPKLEEKPTPVEKPAPAEKESVPPAKPGKKKWLPILIGAAALVLILVFTLPKGGTKSTGASVSASSSTIIPAPSSTDTTETDAYVYYTFGAYEQDNNTANGKEPIEWLVLSVKQDGWTLVISRYALDCKPYHETGDSVTWETSSLRAWLNSDFLEEAFTAEEQAMIQSTTVKGDENPSYHTSGGQDTTDKVFLLSIPEASRLLPSDEWRRCAPTDYAVAQGLWTNSEYLVDGIAACTWWLRTTGYHYYLSAHVDYDGSVFAHGTNVDYGHAAVRPALWINLGANYAVDTRPSSSASNESFGTKPSASGRNEVSYDIVVWVPDYAVDLTRQQIRDFNASNEYGITFNATVEPVSETVAANNMITDVEAGGDIFFFAQDQFARLVQASALDRLDNETAAQVSGLNDPSAVKAATSGEGLFAYPLTADYGYFMYYNKSVIPDADVDSLEALIADCEGAGKYFAFETNTSAWYIASWFFATGCVSEWITDNDGIFISIKDTFNSPEGLIAVKGMKKLVDSPIHLSSSSASEFSSGAAVVVSGIWDFETAKGILGDNLGVTDLPSFTVDGKSYHLGSFSGCKLLGVKPQTDGGKGAALHLLAQYLTSEKAELERFNALSWGPANKTAQADPAVQANPGLVALALQAPYATVQGNIEGSWWDTARDIGDDVRNATNDADLQAVLNNYAAKIDAVFTRTSANPTIWGVVGTINNWGETPDLPMREDSPGIFLSAPLELHAGDEFKVRLNADWTVNYGADGRDGINVRIEKDGVYIVCLDLNAETIFLIPR